MKRWQKAVAAVMLLFALAFAAQTCSGPKFWESRVEQKVDQLIELVEQKGDAGDGEVKKILDEILQIVKKRPISSGGSVKHVCTKEQVDAYAPKQGWIRKNQCPATKASAPAPSNTAQLHEIQQQLDATEEERDAANQKVAEREEMLRNAKKILDEERAKSAQTSEQLASAQKRIAELEGQVGTLTAQVNTPVVVPPKGPSCYPGAKLRINTQTPVEAVKLRYLGQNREIPSTVSPKEAFLEVKCVDPGEYLHFNVRTQKSGAGYVLVQSGQAAQVLEEVSLTLDWGGGRTVDLPVKPVVHPEDKELYYEVLLPSAP